MVTSANNNGTYHLVELDGTRMAVPVAGKRIKAFKKRHEDEPDPEGMDDGNDRIGADGAYRWMCRFCGGGCRGENRP